MMNEKKERLFLWLHHGCSHAELYGDDGEMQCGHWNEGIDFKRSPLSVLRDFVEGLQPTRGVVHCIKVRGRPCTGHDVRAMTVGVLYLYTLECGHTRTTETAGSTSLSCEPCVRCGPMIHFNAQRSEVMLCGTVSVTPAGRCKGCPACEVLGACDDHAPDPKPIPTKCP